MFYFLNIGNLDLELVLLASWWRFNINYGDILRRIIGFETQNLFWAIVLSFIEF